MASSAAASSQLAKPRDSAFEAVVKLAFDDYRQRERTFYLSLKPGEGPDKPDPSRPSWFYAANNIHATEILLTLKSLKPATLLVHGVSTAFNTRMVESCLLPVFQKHDLSSYGFNLVQIVHAGPTTAHWGFKDGWIFGDTRSPLWDQVESTLLRPRSSTDKMGEPRIGKALGYPVESQGRRTVVYMDEGEVQELSKLVGQEVGEVIGMEFFCGDGDEKEWRNIVTHYLRCYKAVESVGGRLTIDLSRHPSLERYFDILMAKR